MKPASRQKARWEMLTAAQRAIAEQVGRAIAATAIREGVADDPFQDSDVNADDADQLTTAGLKTGTGEWDEAYGVIERTYRAAAARADAP
jgi:hypothetical protein